MTRISFDSRREPGKRFSPEAAQCRRVREIKKGEMMNQENKKAQPGGQAGQGKAADRSPKDTSNIAGQKRDVKMLCPLKIVKIVDVLAAN